MRTAQTEIFDNPVTTRHSERYQHESVHGFAEK